MACRVGITVDPERRMSEWRLSHRISSTGRYSKPIARSRPSRRQRMSSPRRMAAAHPGGEGPEYAIWDVQY